MSKICSVKSQFYGAYFHFSTWHGKDEGCSSESYSEYKDAFLCTKGFHKWKSSNTLSVENSIGSFISSGMEWKAYIKESKNFKKTFLSLITQLFPWFQGDIKCFHIPFIVKNFTLYFLNAFFTTVIYYLHFIDFICHSTRKFLSFFFDTKHEWP